MILVELRNLVIFSVIIKAIGSNITYTSNNSSLVNNIRRQLIRNNYDYMSSESDDILTLCHDSVIKHDTIPKSDENQYEEERKEPNNDLIIPRTHDDLKGQETAVLDKDLAYYMNDDRLENVTVGNIDYDIREDVLNADTDMSKVKYKVLKVKNANRRSMDHRRYIQEEKKDEVSILNLGDEPFPEFRLPKSRRQYMNENEDLNDTRSLLTEVDYNLDNFTQSSTTVQ